MANFEAKHIYPYIKEMSVIPQIYCQHIYDMERHKSQVNGIHKKAK